MRRVPILFLMVVLPSSLLAVELVANGGFEDDPAPAWQEEADL